MPDTDAPALARQVFHDPEHERLADGPGYFKTRLLDEEGIAEVKQVVERVFASVDMPFEWANGTFQFTGIHSNPAFVDALYAGLTEFLKPRLDTVFINYAQVLAGVFNKPPNSKDSDLRSHQDPSFVEPPYRTFVAWLPLVSIRPENGGFFVLPGSQHLYPYRPIIQPPVFSTCDRLLLEAGQRIDTEVGDLVVFDTGLVHWSLANSSPVARPAVQFVNVPAEAPFYFPFYTANEPVKRVELYEMPMDQVRKHSWFRPERPTGYKLAKSVDCEFVNLSEQDIIDRVGPYNERVAGMTAASAPAAPALSAPPAPPAAPTPPQPARAAIAPPAPRRSFVDRALSSVAGWMSR